MANAITLSHVTKHYRIYAKPADRLKQMLWRGRRIFFREFAAVEDVSFNVKRGETVGIVGRNGSGKSTLLQMVCGTLNPTSGEAVVNGRVSALLELGAGFNPEFTGKENVVLSASILGLSKEEIAWRYEEIIAFSGLDPAVLAQPVKTYSSGMYVRLAFAVAVAVDPDILVVDEALAVGDEAFQRKCYARIKDMQERGATILFVSHAAQTILELCSRAILMDGGEMLLDASPNEVIAAYHRLIYAAPEKQESIRTALKRGEISAEVSAVDVAEHHDAALTSESRIVYEPHGGSISHPRITTPDGKPVNLLKMGERYQYHYDLELTEPASNICFGMLIKTRRGIHVAGNKYWDTADNLTYPAGSKLAVCFEFDCPLLADSYFMNCGCTKRVGEEEQFIHRIVDALQFKVIDERRISETRIEPVGAVDIAATCTVTKV